MHPDYSKRIIYKSLNAPKGNLLTEVQKANFFVHSTVSRFCEVVCKLKQTVLQSANSLGYRTPAHSTDKNSVFFALTFFERKIMEVFLTELLRLMPYCDSVIWLHDGIWISPYPSEEHVQVAFCKATENFGITDAPFVMQPIKIAYAELFQKLEANKAKKRIIFQSDFKNGNPQWKEPAQRNHQNKKTSCSKPRTIIRKIRKTTGPKKSCIVYTPGNFTTNKQILSALFKKKHWNNAVEELISIN